MAEQEVVTAIRARNSPDLGCGSEGTDSVHELNVPLLCYLVIRNEEDESTCISLKCIFLTNAVLSTQINDEIVVPKNYQK